MKNVGRYRKKAARGIVPRCNARCRTLVDVTDMKNRANRKDVDFWRDITIENAREPVRPPCRKKRNPGQSERGVDAMGKMFADE